MLRQLISTFVSVTLATTQCYGQFPRIRDPRDVRYAEQAARHAELENRIQKRKAYYARIQELQRLANGGNSAAQYQLGVEYEAPSFKEIRPQYAEAAVWYKRAATAGNMPATFRLAILELRGAGVPPDRDKAYYMLKWAGHNGYAPATAYLHQNFTAEDVKRYGIAEKEASARKAATIQGQRDARLNAPKQQAPDSGIGAGLLVAAGIFTALVLASANSGGSAARSESSSNPLQREMDADTGPYSRACGNDRMKMLIGGGDDGGVQKWMGSSEPMSCVSR